MESKIRTALRLDREVHRRIDDLAHERRTSIQKLLEQAVDKFLEEHGDDRAAQITAVSETERRMLEDYLLVLRYGEPDLAESVKSMVYSMVKMIEKQRAREELEKLKRRA